MSNHSTMTPRRLLVASFSAVALVGGLIAAPSLATAAPFSSADTASKIAPEVAASLAGDASAPFWIRFAARTDLSAAKQIDDFDARGRAVYDQLNATADASQGSIKALLDEQGAAYEAFFITNAIYVPSGSLALATEVARSPEVAQILGPPNYVLEEPVSRDAGTDSAAPTATNSASAVEWGLTNIRAPQVWATGNEGQGIVVANIDTGVQYNHPALVAQYRGNKGGGSFNHNYNWFRASGSSQFPVDGNGHGTHTMGTMVGDDGGSNQIGVAPRAKWITANGCCPSDAALIASGQWMLAPKKLDGSRPRPKKRPHIVNNSWGSSSPSDAPFMEDVILAWEASGIFGQWSNGNSGPSCHTSGSPGSRLVTYSAGAYDISNNIASFSARGPGQSSGIKPNIAAPGVNVRSSVPTNGYANFSGTSMSSPHVAGAIALLWSGVPSLARDIDATRALLDDTAINVSALTCGGTVDDNNVFGEGRLDAKALVDAGLALDRE